MRLQREMARVEEMNLGAGDIAPIGLSAAVDPNPGKSGAIKRQRPDKAEISPRILWLEVG